MRKIISKKLVSGVLFSLVVFANLCAAPKAKYRTLDKIKKSGTIKIAVFSDKKPFGYVDEYGKYQGYDVYFGDRIAKDLGVKVKYVPVEAAARVEVLQTGKVDLVLANFTVTPELAEKVDLSVTYIGMIERDEKVPKLETFVRIANALGCCADELLCDVIDSGYEVKISKYTEQIGKLPIDEQQKIYSVIEALLKK